MYSTVGVRVPICLRRMLLNTCTASFLPSKSTLCKLRINNSNNPLLYTSWLSWATMMSDWLLALPLPNKVIYIVRSRDQGPNKDTGKDYIYQIWKTYVLTCICTSRWCISVGSQQHAKVNIKIAIIYVRSVGTLCNNLLCNINIMYFIPFDILQLLR